MIRKAILIVLGFMSFATLALGTLHGWTFRSSSWDVGGLTLKYNRWNPKVSYFKDSPPLRIMLEQRA